MKIPGSILTMIKVSPTDNLYFSKAEQAWERLTEIRNGNIQFIDDDYSMLINTMERFYKGYIQSKIDNDKSYSIEEGFLTCDHNLVKLVDEISKTGLSLFNETSRSDYHERCRFLKELRWQYTAARYSENIYKEDFDQLYDLVKIQKDKIYDHLNEKEISPGKDTFSLDL